MGTTNYEGTTWGGKKKIGSKVTNVAPAYRTCWNQFEAKIVSFKTLFNQTHGPAKCPRPSTTVLNNFANWVNKGAIVQTCSNAQLSRWARSCNINFNPRTVTPTTCRTILCSTFGKSTIKAVARTKTGSFMVATSPTVKGKPFYFGK